jgi:hypothetical protein
LREPHDPPDAEIVNASVLEIERGRLVPAGLRNRDGATRELRQRAGEQRGSRHNGDPEHSVPPERELRDVSRRGLPLVELHDPDGLRPQLRGGVRARVALEEADGDQRGDDAGEHDPEQEQRGKAKAQ